MSRKPLFHNDEDFATRLLTITDKCRPDMHEPNEQDVFAQILGSHAHAGVDGVTRLEGDFDNACGDTTDGTELVVALTRELDWDDEGSPTDIRTEHFNLATLIALARIGATVLTKRNREMLYGWVEKTIEELRADPGLTKRADRYSLAGSLEIAFNGAKHHDPLVDTSK